MGFRQPALFSALVLLLFVLPGTGFVLSRSKLSQASEDRKSKLEEIRDMFGFVFCLYAIPALLAGFWFALGPKVASTVLGAALVPLFLWIAIASRREKTALLSQPATSRS